MKLDKLSYWAIILASLAVLATLAYLISHTDRNTETVKGEAKAEKTVKKNELAWMIGCWRTADGMTTEKWSEGAYSHIFGHSVTLEQKSHSKEVSFFENLNIMWTGYGYQLSAYPMGEGPTNFQSYEWDPQAITFENKTHDYPQRITYSRDGDTLTGTISMADGTKPKSWVYSRCAG